MKSPKKTLAMLSGSGGAILAWVSILVTPAETSYKFSLLAVSLILFGIWLNTSKDDK